MIVKFIRDNEIIGASVVVPVLLLFSSFWSNFKAETELYLIVLLYRRRHLDVEGEAVGRRSCFCCC